ncbi:MAG: TIGR00282 family metallophosphoesterase [Erysipelotrichaceae bacterium]|nr:TIGR00282 family metallophosphoesterase [Erysipelotrichaceae bacterium]
MRVLFLGDVAGSVGREVVTGQLDELRREYAPDLVIVNGENAAHGKGITRRIYRELKNIGVDIITLGNHAFSKKEIIEQMDELDDLARPLNLEPYNVGMRVVTKEVCDLKVAVVNVLGQVFMDDIRISPFEAFDEVLEEIDADIVIVDFHGEATSEKRIFFEYYKGKVNAVIGTHTHVQTADEMIEDGCAFISDVGMCGPYHSILGRDTNEVIEKIVFGKKTHYTPAEGPGIICGVVIDFDDQTCQAKDIIRIQKRPL